MTIFSTVAPITLNTEGLQQMIIQNDSLIQVDEPSANLPVFSHDATEEGLDQSEGSKVYSPVDSTQIMKEGKIDYSLSRGVFYLYSGGVLISLGITIISYHKFRKKIGKGLSPLSSEQAQATRGLIKDNITVFVTSRTQSPMVIGVFKSKLILTESLFENSGEGPKVTLKEGAENVIKHEMMHLYRKDLLWKYLYLLARTIHWFNPLIYVIGPVMNEDIELSCDEHLAKSMNPLEKKDYCTMMLNLIAQETEENYLYSTNFTGGMSFMKKRFKNIIKVGEKRGVFLSVVLALLMMGSAVLVSCTGDSSEGADELLRTPAYHLFPFRAEPFHLFYESDEKIGFQIMDGIFLYNYREDKMEHEFALEKEAFDENYVLSVAMGEEEKNVIVSSFNGSDGQESEYYYEYDLSKQTLKRINENPKEAKTKAYPNEERQEKALTANSWELRDLLYYPEESVGPRSPFKKENLPLKEYYMDIEEGSLPKAPALTLTDEGEFKFTYAYAMNYLNFGKYDVNGDVYTLRTDPEYAPALGIPEQRTFIFTKDGENLVFNEEESFTSILDNGQEIKDGTVFRLD